MSKPSMSAGIALDDLRPGRVGHLIRDDVVHRQADLALCLAQQLAGQVHLVALDQALADLFVLSEEEGVGHRAADEQRVGLVQQRLDDVDLVGDLGAAEDRDERALAACHGVAEELQLLLDEEADRPRLALHHLRHAEGAGVLAVGGAEGVIDVDVAELRELAGEVGVVLLLVLMESEVLQQQDVAVGQLRRQLLHRAARCSRRRSGPIVSALDSSGSRVTCRSVVAASAARGTRGPSCASPRRPA